MVESPSSEIAPTAAERRLATTIRDVVTEILGPAPDIDRLVAAHEQVVAIAEDLSARWLANNPPPRPIGCQAGCAWCCRSLSRPGISMTGFEAATLAHHLATRAPADRRRLAALAGENLKQPDRSCPFLDVEGLCAVYPVRPLVCRALASLAPETCREAAGEGETGTAAEAAAAGATVPVYAPRRATFDAVHAGIIVAGRALGLQSEQLEIRPVTSRLLEADPDRMARDWLAGGDPFAGCDPEAVVRA